MRRDPIAWTLFGVLPALLVLAFTLGARHQPAYDFHALWQAGRDVAHGRDPYPAVASISNSSAPHDEFVYPAPFALVMAPLGPLPFGVAAGIFVTVLVASVAATLRILGVRDWRCYGVAFGSIPVLESFRLGAVTPLLALGLAAAWAARDRRWALPVLVAGVVLAKLFLWPVFVWLLATRRWAAAARSALLSVAVAAIGWGVVGFGTLDAYPAVLRRMTEVQFRKSYGIDGLVASLGAGASSAHLGVMAVAVAGAAAVAAAARWGGGPELAFCVAIVVSLLASPLVWLHYETLLLVPVALASRRLSLWWFLPLLLWATPHPESGGSALRIGFVAVVAAVSVLGRAPVGRLIRWKPLRGVAQPG